MHSVQAVGIVYTEKKLPLSFSLISSVNPLPPIQMPVPPQAFDNIIANADYQADRKEARDKIAKRENDLAVMRTNIVAMTDKDWLRWTETKQVTQARFESFNIIGILKDHKQ